MDESGASEREDLVFLCTALKKSYRLIFCIMDDMSSMSAGAAPENTNIARYLSKRAIAIGGRSAPQGTPPKNSSSATGPFIVPLEQEGRLPCSGFFDQGDRLSPEKRHKEHGRKKTGQHFAYDFSERR